MKKILIGIILLFLVKYNFAQNITIKGFVLNDSTNAPVLSANICIKGYPIGVSTNEAGEFSFHIPEGFANDTLNVSAIGFKSYECVINKITKADSMLILLQEQVYELANVIVFPGDELNQIIKNVTKNLKKNYPRRKYMLNGFYRELVLKDNNYTRLIEAAIDIQKQGINSEVGDRIRVNELRKSDSNVEYDWKSFLFEKINGEDNNLYKILSNDIVSFHDNAYITDGILTKDFIDKYDFVLENISMIDSVKVYEIRFCKKLYYGEYKGDFTSIENHWISVREDNFAIIKYTFKLQFAKDFERTRGINFEDNCFLKHTVYYKEYKGKYYPYLFEALDYIVAKEADEKTGKGKQYMKSSLLINNISTNRDGYEKVKEKFASPADIELYKLDYKYNPEFWANYNIIKLNPLYTQVKNDLEDGKTLEEQFISNGK